MGFGTLTFLGIIVVLVVWVIAIYNKLVTLKNRYVNAFCPHCHREDPVRPLETVRRLSGWLVERDDRIWLERGCPDHGLVSTLYDESPEILRYLEQWTAPTKTHVPDVRGNFDPVPSAYLRGLPEMQTQHTCILLADITAECNLRCPTCFTDSSPELTGVAHWPTCWRASTPGSRARTDASTSSCSPEANRRCTRTWRSC